MFKVLQLLTLHIYEYNDLSAITENQLKPLQFVGIDRSTLNKSLVRVYYLVWDNKKSSGVVKNAWVKKSSVSTDKNDWSASIKYFLATVEDVPDVVNNYLEIILKRYNSSVFVPLIEEMIKNDNFIVAHVKLEEDSIFAGTSEQLLQSYTGNIYEEQSLTSKVMVHSKFNY